MHRLDYNRRRELPSAPPDDVRQALRQFASGVTIVTAEHGGEQYGITVSAFTSISLDPPIIMVSINSSSPLADMVMASEHFAVHILGNEHEELSARFAAPSSGSEKYRELDVKPGSSGAPTMEGMLALFDCVLDQTLAIGTHILMFGRVVHAVSAFEPGSPLLYYHRSYRRLDI